MQAIIVHKFADYSSMKIEQRPDPKPSDGQLLIDVKAVGVNPVDTYVAAGTYASKPELPYIPGTEGAGVIADGPRRGERVYFLGTAGPRNTGTFAQKAVCREQDVHPLPDHLSFAEGAAVPVAFGTAWRALFDGPYEMSGKTVLIHGASGGVGTAAVQLARMHGMTVIGTAGSDQGMTIVRTCGAQHVLNHKNLGYLEEVTKITDGQGVDLVVEMLANVNLDKDLDILARHGHVCVVGSRGRIEIDPRKMMGRESSVRGMTLWGGGDESLARAYADINQGLSKKLIKPIVDQVAAVGRRGQGFDLVMQGGSSGKIVLDVAG